MKRLALNVPFEVMVEFSEALTNRSLDNFIAGVTEDDEIIVQLVFESNQSKAVNELEEILDDLIEQLEEEYPDED